MIKEALIYRQARSADMPLVHSFVRELAAFQHARSEVSTTVKSFQADGFSSESWFTCFVAEHKERGIVGIALCHKAFSPRRGRIIALKDLIVDETLRGQGISSGLLNCVFTYAKEQGACATEWMVHTWNEPAIAIFEKLGAKIDDTRFVCSINAAQVSERVNKAA